MKTILIAVVIVSSLLGGCDRDTLQGLNLKFKGEINSDYQQKEANNEDSSQSNSPVTENTPSREEKPNNGEKNTSEVRGNKPVKEVNNQSNSDPDAPLPFNPLKDCSDSGINAKTNEIFYANNGNVKSINSKNEEEVKEWKSIYNEVKSKCQNN